MTEDGWRQGITSIPMSRETVGISEFLPVHASSKPKSQRSMSRQRTV